MFTSPYKGFPLHRAPNLVNVLIPVKSNVMITFELVNEIF